MPRCQTRVRCFKISLIHLVFDSIYDPDCEHALDEPPISNDEPEDEELTGNYPRTFVHLLGDQLITMLNKKKPGS